MSKWIGLLAAAAAMIALGAGCGSSSNAGSGRPTRTVVQVQHARRDRWWYARERFREQCGGCHTLADAGTHGKRFNLDHDGDINEDRARFAIANGEPGMPPWRPILTRREFEELIAYVSNVEKQTDGDTNWSWQAKLRTEGERWRQEDGPYAPDGVEGMRIEP
jgi:hypothetical protein